MINERIQQLRKELRKHEHLYYVKSEPVISDIEYDRLYKELAELEKANPHLITPDSPTQRIGETVTSFLTRPHRVPMMSIDNSYSINDIKDWILRLEKLAGRDVFPIVAELKIDGVSGSLHYSGKTFQDGSTRGNGIEGDLITENLRTIKSLPLSIKSDFDMDIRGEIYTAKSKLVELNQARIEKGEDLFKNCRNLTSGTVKSLDPKVAASRGLQIMVYGIAQAKALGFTSHSEALKFLSEQGFKLNERFEVCNNIDEIEKFISKIQSEKDQLDFDIDGIVLKVDSLSLQEELGETSKAPRWAIAYKYPQDRVETILKEVTWQVGRQQLTPVAELEPVEIGGTTVSRASLHNLDQIEEKDIRIGDTVIIEKAGYIIPYVVAPKIELRTDKTVKITPPQKCPACEGSVEVYKSGEEDKSDSTIVRCTNPNCVGVLSRRIIYFISQMEIENFGPQLVDQLLNQGILKSVEDLFTLSIETLANLERMGQKSAEKVFASIQNAKKASLGKLISALGIPNVGTVLGEDIAEAFKYDFHAFLNSTPDDLVDKKEVKIKGVKFKVAADIISFLSSPENTGLIEALKSWWTGPDEDSLKEQKKSNILEGKTFVITGEAEVPRKLLEELVKNHGGAVKSSVSKATQYLLIGSKVEENFTSSKKSKANSLNVPIINENDLFDLVGVTLEDVKNSGKHQ